MFVNKAEQYGGRYYCLLKTAFSVATIAAVSITGDFHQVINGIVSGQSSIISLGFHEVSATNGL